MIGQRRKKNVWAMGAVLLALAVMIWLLLDAMASVPVVHCADELELLEAQFEGATVAFQLHTERAERARKVALDLQDRIKTLKAERKAAKEAAAGKAMDEAAEAAKGEAEKKRR